MTDNGLGSGIPSGGSTGPKSGPLPAWYGWAFGLLLIIFGLTFVGNGAERIGWALSAFGLLLLPVTAKLLRLVHPVFRREGVPSLVAVAAGVVLLIANPGSRAGNTNPVGSNAGAAGGSPGRTAEIQALWSELTTVTQQCDQAASTASSSLDLTRSNLTQAYAAVEDAKAICARVGLQVMGIDAPRSLDGEAREAFDDALNKCGLAYAGKSVMFDRMLKVVDGDRRPSRIAAVQEAAQTSQAETVQCAMTINALAEAQGVVLSETAIGSWQGAER